MFEDQIASARKEGFSDDEILNHIKNNKPDMAEKINGALKEKFTATDILNYFAPNSRPAEPGAFDLDYLGGQFKRGLGSAIEGYAKTAKVLGADAQNTQPFEVAGQRMQQGAPRSAMDRFSNPGANDVTLGGKSLSAIPGVVAEGGAGLIADLGAMVAGNAVAPGLGFAAPIASYGLREYGRQLEERQANNGGAPASGADQAAVGASVVAQGALNRVGLGALNPGVKLGSNLVTDPLKRIATATGAEGLTNAAQEGLSQLGTVAGTKQGQYDGSKIVDAGLIGGAIGGTVRTAAEAGRLPKVALGEMAKRGYDYQDELPNVTNRIAQVSEEQGRKLGDRYQDGASLKEVADEIHSMRKADSGLNAYAKAIVENAFRSGMIGEAAHGNALAALTETAPTKTQIKSLEEVTSKLPDANKQEIQGAIQLAKRAATVEQMKVKSNFQEGKQTLFKGKVPYVSGGSSRVAAALTDRAKSILMGAAGGSLTYAGLAGLGNVAATGAALSKAAPVAAGLYGAYQGTKLLDKALGTYSPVQQIVESSATKGLNVAPLGGDLPSIRQEQMEAAQQKAEAQAQAKQQATEEREATARDREYEAAGKQNARNEKKFADQAAQLVKIQRELDKAQGITRDETEYTGISQIRGDLTDTIREAKLALAKAKAEKKAPVKEGPPPAPPEPPAQPVARPSDAEIIQQGQFYAQQEVQLAERAKAVANLQRELDKKNGVKPNKKRYEAIESIRDPDTLDQVQERLKPEPVKTAKSKKTDDAPPPSEPVAETGQPRKANTTLRLAIQDIASSAKNKKEQRAVQNKLNNIFEPGMTIEKAREIISAVSVEHPSVAKKLKQRLDNKSMSLLETQLRDPKAESVEFTKKKDPKAALYGTKKYEEGADRNQNKSISDGLSAVRDVVPAKKRATFDNLADRFRNEGWRSRREELLAQMKKLVSKDDKTLVHEKISPLLKDPRRHKGGATRHVSEESYLAAKGRKNKD